MIVLVVYLGASNDSIQAYIYPPATREPATFEYRHEASTSGSSEAEKPNIGPQCRPLCVEWVENCVRPSFAPVLYGRTLLSTICLPGNRTR